MQIFKTDFIKKCERFGFEKKKEGLRILSDTILNIRIEKSAVAYFGSE